jgi:hypothetical protein
MKMDEKTERPKTELRFELNEEKTVCNIFRKDIHIGRVWAEQDSLFPFPHDNTLYCKNSIQICGFDHMSEVWACGPFSGKKDCVVHFIPTDDEYYQQKSKEYAKYVQDFFKAETKTLHDGVGPFNVTDMKVRDGKDLGQLKSFRDWLATGGCL